MNLTVGQRFWFRMGRPWSRSEQEGCEYETQICRVVFVNEHRAEYVVEEITALDDPLPGSPSLEERQKDLYPGRPAMGGIALRHVDHLVMRGILKIKE